MVVTVLKRVPACTKASNSYHECNENCLERISGAEGGEIE